MTSAKGRGGRIAAVVLTHNEVGNLERCVRTLQSRFPVVIVDSGSTDGTPELAQKLGCSVILQEWQGFATQRNFACEILGAQYDWLLFVDADEIFGDELLSWMVNYVDTGNSADVVYFSQKIVIGDKSLRYAPHYPIYHPRLVRSSFDGFINSRSGHGETISAKASFIHVDIPYSHFILSHGLDSWLGKHVRLATMEVRGDLTDASGVVTPRSRLSSKVGVGLPRIFYRFIFHYVICRGFLDGKAGLQYALMYAWFEFTKTLLLRDNKIEH